MTISPKRIAKLTALTIATFGLVGCGKNGSAGGPGTDGTGSKPPLYGQNDNTFNLTASSVSIKQGEVVPGSIGIKRGTNFDQDVTIAFADVPKGVTFDPAAPVLKSAETETKFNWTASDDTVPGDYMIKVTGHPAKGGDASNQFKLTVAKKDTFTLTVPFWTTGLKQGETKSVTIGISRDKQFDQDVALSFTNLPKGVTIEPAGFVIKKSDADAKFSFKAADDAALGDFAVMMTGHPVKGADATHEFKFTVAKK